MSGSHPQRLQFSWSGCHLGIWTFKSSPGASSGHLNADLDSVGPGWAPKFCISKRLPSDAACRAPF